MTLAVRVLLQWADRTHRIDLEGPGFDSEPLCRRLWRSDSCSIRLNRQQELSQAPAGECGLEFSPGRSILSADPSLVPVPAASVSQFPQAFQEPVKQLPFH